MSAELPRNGRALLLTLVWVALLALFFAEVEIQIEGAAGWAANLPTWRIEQHWLLDIFWGGRPMTGYHAWVFSFMALIFFIWTMTFCSGTGLSLEAIFFAASDTHREVIFSSMRGHSSISSMRLSSLFFMSGFFALFYVLF